MRIPLVYIVNHFLRAFYPWSTITCIRILTIRKIFHVFLVAHLINIARILELHGVPVRITSPILPILNDSIQRNFPITVFINHFAQFIRTLITLAALPESKCPKRIKRSLPGQITDSGYHAIRIATINEIIVGTIAHFRVE